jgi:bifunctional UDP-N-acetylglucosamine pyrophosphorylase/glucosamine-1-phosphate N-acetyltransferase
VFEPCKNAEIVCSYRKRFRLVSKHLEELNKKINIAPVLQEKRLGSGHALLQVKKYAAGLKGHLIVMCGDTPLVKQTTIKQLLRYHIKNKNFATVLSGIAENPYDTAELSEILQAM